MLRRLMLLAGLSLSPLTALAIEDVTEFHLDNGMQVVVIEDPTSPAVVHMVWYRVGAADEPPGQSGVAHYLEHLMFKGTDDLSEGEFSSIVAENGGTDNAFTSWDYTGYFQRVAADRLGLMMEMEADRMTDLAFTEEQAVTELSVVLEERAQRTDSRPGSLFNEQLRAALYLNHPYAIPIIGWRHEIETLDRDGALAFYADHYAPNNAILIVAGGVSPDEVRRLAETHYGPIPANPAIADRARPSEPPHLAERRVVYEDERVANPYVSRTYLTQPRRPGAQENAAALTLLAEILGGSGSTSVLARQLEIEEERSIYTSAFFDAVSYDPSGFSLINVPVPGQSLAEAEADLDRAVASFLEQGIDPEQFARIQFRLEAAAIYGADDAEGLAQRYGRALTGGLTVADVQAWPEVLAATTVEDVMRAAERLFTETTSVTGYLRRPEPIPTEEVMQ